MDNSYEKFKKNWLYLIIFGIISFSVTVFINHFLSLKYSSSAIEHYDDFVIEKLKNNVKAEVLSRIDEVEYDLEKIEREENLVIKNKVLELGRQLLESGVSQINNNEKRQEAAILEFERIIKNDSEYLYFIMDPEGYLLRSGTDERMEKLNLLNSYVMGISPVREVIRVKDKPEGDYVTYYWPKVKDGEPLKKTSFCLYIPEFDFIIGTGNYEEDVYQKLENEIYSRLQSYYEDKDNYIFVFGYDGDIKVYPDKSLIGQDINFIEKNSLNELHSRFLKLLENKEEFMQYKINKKNESEISEKITYIQTIKDWKVYMGMGFHLVDIQEEVLTNTRELERNHMQNTLINIIFLSVVGIISSIFINRGLKLQQNILQKKDIVFEQLFQMVDRGIVIVEKDNNIIYQNAVVKKMFGGQCSNLFGNKLSEDFKLIKDEQFSYTNKNNREYFFEIEIKEVLYKGMNSNLYLINNITRRYITENNLDLDLLTMLPNKRALEIDFDDLLTKTNLDTKNHLAKLSLDNFNNIRETNGRARTKQILKEFGKFMKANLREKDGVYLFEEGKLIILFKELDAKQIKKTLDEYNLQMGESMLNKFGFFVYFSAGVIQLKASEKKSDFEILMKKTDDLLQQAKDNNGMRVELDRELW